MVQINGVKASSSRGVLMAGLVLSENTCFPTGSQGVLELPIRSAKSCTENPDGLMWHTETTSRGVSVDARRRHAGLIGLRSDHRPAARCAALGRCWLTAPDEFGGW